MEHLGQVGVHALALPRCENDNLHGGIVELEGENLSTETAAPPCAIAHRTAAVPAIARAANPFDAPQQLL